MGFRVSVIGFRAQTEMYNACSQYPLSSSGENENSDLMPVTLLPWLIEPYVSNHMESYPPSHIVGEFQFLI